MHKFETFEHNCDFAVALVRGSKSLGIQTLSRHFTFLISVMQRSAGNEAGPWGMERH